MSKTLDLLRAVNGSVNREIEYAADSSLYGRSDKWSRPIVVDGERLKGDCEDYALEKRHRLMKTGKFSPMDVRLLLCLTPAGKREGKRLDHAVLAVSHGDRWHILDNRSMFVLSIERTEYVRTNWWFPEIRKDGGQHRWLIDGKWTRHEVRT